MVRFVLGFIAFLMVFAFTACTQSTLTEEKVRNIAQEYAGAPGPTGPQGEPGPPGIQGIEGRQGSPGLIGEQGVQGEKGDTGSIGPQGQKGNVGSSGEQGPPGPQGVKGDTGAPPPTPRPTPTPTIPSTPTPAPTPVVSLADTEIAAIWVLITQDLDFPDRIEVRADIAIDIAPFDLTVFIDGAEYCNTNQMYGDEGVYELGCEWLETHHSSVNQVSAQVRTVGGLRCERHVESTEVGSLFACGWR